MLPQDPVMLLSYMNMKLRDNYSSLDALCDDLEINKEELANIVSKLEGIGYTYNSERNQFI
jgi:biotin operon repressor